MPPTGRSSVGWRARRLSREETGNGRLDLGRAALDTGTGELRPAGVAGQANGGPFVGPYVAASSTNVTTNGVTGMEPATAPQGAAKVRVLSFRITPTAADTFKSLKVQYTGTNVADIATVFLYQESGTVPGSFTFATETARGSTAAQTAGEYTLDPADFALTAGVTVQFYVAVDLAAGATLGNVVDFKFLVDKITLTTGASFTWPTAAQITAGTWDPTGTTKVATAPSFGTLTAEADNGTVAFAGSSNESAGTYTVKGGGLSTATADAFHLVYKQMTGDSTITARVTSVQNTNGSARAGVVMRDALTTGSMVAIVASNPTNGISFGYRLTTGGSGTETAPAASASPYWVRLTRFGNTFRADRSPDGVTWTQVGTTQTIAMSTTFYVGIGVSAGDDAFMNTSTFDNVSVTVPAADFANPNEGAAIIQGSTSVSIRWSEAGPATTRSLQRQKGNPSAAGSCSATSWSADAAAVATVSPVTQAALVTATCYRWTQTLNGSFVFTSGTVLVDTTAPSAPSVVATTTAFVYQATPNGVVYFRPAAASTMTLTASGSDSDSGISKQAYPALVATGWTPTYAQSSADDAGATWTFGSTAVSTSVTVKAINTAVGLGFVTKVPAVTTSIAGLSNEVAVSPDGQFAAFATATTPFVQVFRWAGTGFGLRMPNPATLPQGQVHDLKFSPNGDYLALANEGTPNVTVYDWSSAGFGTKLADPASMLGGNAIGVAWNPAGDRLALVGNTSPYLAAWPFATGFGTRYANAATPPASVLMGVTFSPDGTHVAVAGISSPFVEAWNFASGFGTKVTNPATLPTGSSNSVAFSPDGSALAVTMDASPRIHVYGWSSAGFGAKFANPATLPTGIGNDVAFGPLGQNLAVAHTTTPFVSLYPWSPTGFGTKLANPAALPSGTASNAVAFSPRGAVIVATDNGTTASVVGYQEETPSSATTITVTADATAPTISLFTPSANALQAGTSVTPTWTETEGGSGVGSRSLQRRTGTPSPAASCATTTWADDGAAVNVASGVAQTGLSSGSCYQWTLTVTDNVGNPSGTSTSSWILVDTSAPSAPSVTASGTNVYQAAANGTVFFKSGGTGTMNLVATAADAQSGLANIIFASPAAATGWSGTPAFPNTDATSPYAQADNWIATAGSGTQAVTATNGVGATAATTLTITADATAPTISYSIPTAGTTVQLATSVNVTWSETETGSGVASRSLQRQKGAIVVPGTCVGVSYANDGAADTAVSPRLNSSLVGGNCYQWVQTVTDNVGNIGGPTTSGQVAILLNAAPTAVADGYTTNEDTTLAVPVTGAPYNGVLFNDTDPETDPLTAILVTDVATGTLGLGANGSFSYTPVPNANGVVTFTYKANDGQDSNTVTVTITITAVNDIPSFTVGANQAVAMGAAAQSVSGWATALSRGPADESGQVLDFIVSNDFNGLFATQPAVSATGTLTYTPAATASGIATVTVRIHDNGGVLNGGVDTSATQTFTIPVSDGAYVSSAGWSMTFDTGRYLDLTFPAYVPAGSIVTGATFRHEYRSSTGGDTTCYYFEVYSGVTLLATHGSAGSPVSCNATTTYASDAVALPEVDTVSEANALTIRLFVRNSGGHHSAHRMATLGVTSSLP